MELLVILKKIFPNEKFIVHSRKILPKWNAFALELDIYLPELRIAFEYMGQQHYDKGSFDALTKGNRNLEDFEYQKYKDRCKKKMCKLKGITLIKIKYDEKLSEQLVLSKLKYTNIKTTQTILNEIHK